MHTHFVEETGGGMFIFKTCRVYLLFPKTFTFFLIGSSTFNDIPRVGGLCHI